MSDETNVLLAVLPVKDLWQAKQRLGGLLSAAERRALCLVMLADVLGALRAARRLSGILVFSADEEALDLARQYGAMAVREPCGHGQSAAISGAIPVCRERGATSILTIPLDAPLLTGTDVDELISCAEEMALPSPSAIIVPSADGTGTNALLLTPPEAIPPRFGPNSLPLHIQEAEELGIAYRLFQSPRLALDVDSPADLAAFLCAAERGPGQHTRTYQHLVRTGLAERCRAMAL